MPLLFRVSFLHSCFSLSQPHADSRHACQQQHHRHPVSYGRILSHRVRTGATAKACHGAFFFQMPLLFTIQMSTCNLLTDTDKRTGTCGLTIPVFLLNTIIRCRAPSLGDDAARVVNAIICRRVSPMPTIHHSCIVIPHFLNLSVAHWLFRLVFLVVSTCTSPLFSTACLLFVWVAEQSSPNVWVRINGRFCEPFYMCFYSVRKKAAQKYCFLLIYANKLGFSVPCTGMNKTTFGWVQINDPFS